MNLHHLPKSHIEALPAWRAWSIDCVSGTVWVTVDGRPEDIILEAGEHFVTPAGERTLIYALDDAQVRIEQPQPAEQAAARPAQGRRTPPWPGRLRPALGLWSALRQLGV